MRYLVRAVPNVFVVALLLVSSFGPASTSQAAEPSRAPLAVTAVGPTDPTTGYPAWYQDANGLALKLCNDAADAHCIVLAPALGDPPEFFYYYAEASVNVNGGALARMRLALEATYVDALQLPQDRMTFGRVSFRVASGLTPGQTYTINHPFGQLSIVADVDGGARTVEDIGCTDIPPGTCNFSLALASNIGNFLIAVTPPPPTGYIGTPTLTQTVTGGTNGNLFVINGLSVGGVGINTVQTDQWTLSGKKAITAVADTVQVAPDANNVPLDVLANDIGNPGETLTIAAAPSPTAPANGSVTTAAGNTHLIYSSQNRTGADPFDYTATNGAVFSTATVNLTVRAGANSPPVATTDTVIVAQSSTANIINVLTNDSDPNGDLFFVSAVGAATKGTATVGTAGRKILYTPTAGQSGADTFTYTVSDGAIPTATGTVNVTIDQAPVGVADTATVAANSSANVINVLANDIDPDVGATLTVTAVAQPAHGTAAIGTAGANVTYTPTASYNGGDSFTYTLSDGTITATATVNLTVDRPPVAVNDSFTIDVASSNNPLSVLANDSDPDAGTTITVSAVTQPANGLASIGPASANIIYTPNPGFSGSDIFTYTVSDGFLTANATVTAVVNRAPVASGDTARIPQNSSNQAITVLSNDSDPDGNTIAVSAVTQPAHGTSAVGTAGANVTYTPAAGFAGADSFAYTITDGSLTSSASITVTVERAPLAATDSATVAKDSINNVINVLTNDIDPDGNAPAVISVTQGANGSVSYPAGGASVTYSPNPGFFGNDTFTYTITDGLMTATGTVNVTVNRSPTTANDTALVNMNTANNPLTVLHNDTDPDGNPLTVTAVTQSLHGTVAIGTDGHEVLYTPAAGYTGADSFTYTISDGFATATGSVAVTIHLDNRAPVATADTVSVAVNSSGNSLNVMLNDSDPDTNPIQITSVTQGGHGSTSVDAGGHHVIYTPAAGFTGTDGFSYTITDGALTATATVVVNIRAVLQPPVAANDSLKVPVNSTGNQLHILDNDSDPVGDPLLVVSVTPAAHGQVSVATEGREVIYTPLAGFTGTDTFTYTISNGGLTATATATVTVHGNNTTPIAINDSIVVVSGIVAAHLLVMSNDSDPDGDSFYVSAVSQPAHGTAVAPEDGDMVHYTPTAGFTGVDTFTYTIKDGALTATATVIVSVNQGANRPPVATTDSIEVSQNSSQNHVNVLANDSDPDGDSFTITYVGGAAHGTVVIGVGASDVFYTPEAGYTGADSFTYTINDGQATTNGTVTVTVIGDRPPAAAGDSYVIPMNSANNPLNVRNNDSDPDGKPLTITAVGAASGGTVAIGLGGVNVIYTPNPTFSGSDSFTYTISDGSLTATGTVNITVSTSNNPPMPAADTGTIRISSGNNTMLVLINDTDPDGNPLSVIRVTQPDHGSVAIASDRTSVIYAPNPGYSGADGFTYTVSDGAMTVETTVNISVQGVSLFMPILSERTSAW